VKPAARPFHYLRRTKQIDGKNVEIEADRYAEGALRAFQALEEYGGLARPDPKGTEQRRNSRRSQHIP
jgi:hypothetical protein